MDVWTVKATDLPEMTTAELCAFIDEARAVYRQCRDRAEYDDWAYTNGTMLRLCELALVIALANDLACGREATGEFKSEKPIFLA